MNNTNLPLIKNTEYLLQLKANIETFWADFWCNKQIWALMHYVNNVVNVLLMYVDEEEEDDDDDKKRRIRKLEILEKIEVLFLEALKWTTCPKWKALMDLKAKSLIEELHNRYSNNELKWLDNLEEVHEEVININTWITIV